MCKICSKLTIKTSELSQLLIRRPSNNSQEKTCFTHPKCQLRKPSWQLFIITKQLPGFFVVFDTDGSVDFADATVLVATVVDGVESDSSNDKKS